MSAVIPPLVQLVFIGADAGQLGVRLSMDRQALVFLPTLNCPYVLLQISGNFLPGIEPLSTA
jgi:hypothetical protein